MSIDFEAKQKNVPVAFSELRDEFDVRADGTVDQGAAEEMALRGKIINSVITQDNVYLDGRTGAVGQLVQADTLGTPGAIVLCDVLGFRYDRLTNAQKAEFHAESLRRNHPTGGYRRIATDEDCIKTIEGMIRLGQTKAKIQELLPYLGSRFNRQFDNANNTVIQQKLVQARQLMKDEHLTDLEAAKRVGLRSAEGIVNTTRVHDKAFNAMKKKQAAITKAVTAVGNYATARVKALREGKTSGKVIEQLVANDTKQLVRLTRVHESATQRVTRELQNYIPGYHLR